MPSLILQTATRYLIPLLLMFSVFILLRGHNAPGGGFVGGLVVSAAFALYAIAYDTRSARKILGISPGRLIGIGLLMAVSAGILGLLVGEPFLQALWYDTELPAIGKPGTPLLFDFGIYTVVIGVVLLIIFTLAEE